MKWQGRRQSGNLDDRRGMSGKGKLAAGGGVIAVVVILLQIFGGETGQQLAPILEQVNQTQSATSTGEQRELTPQEKELGQFMDAIIVDTEDIWSQIFRENNLGSYKEPTVVLFTDAVRTGCGNASATSGPFYCPADQKVYMDLSFFDELKTRFGAQGGDFAIAYVTAHEIGHHVQTLLGTSNKVRQLQQQTNEAGANRLSVAQELQADFYAGLWAGYNKDNLDVGDIDEALSAAQAVGDDAIQRRTQGSVTPDSFTHGTSEQRKYWFMKGYNSGDINQGDTFSALLK